MPCLSATICLAKEMGKSVGSGKILFQAMWQQQDKETL